jgi:hypothetical protein
MWGQQNNKFKFNFEQNDKKENQAGFYTKSLIKGDINKFNCKLIDDYKKLINDKCVYIPKFICQENDLTLFNKLKKELFDNSNPSIISWSKHKKHDNPKFSPTFNYILEQMAKEFNMDIVESRLNYYENGNDWKPFHHDRHAYGNIKENYTIGVSLGAERCLEFKHVESGNILKFPQKNGDLFAFDKEINQLFQHSIPKDFLQKTDRISIIAWGVKK